MTRSEAITALYALFNAPHNADINLVGLNVLLDELYKSHPQEEPWPEEPEGHIAGGVHPPQRTERPVDCERCNRLEEQAYDLVGKLRVANIKLSMQPQRTEQEPVKIVQYNCKCGRTMKFESVHGVVAPQRTWVELTEDDKVLINHDANFNQFMTAGEYADRVQALTEARLKDKNT